MLCEATSMCVGTLWRSVIVRVSVHVAASACKCEVCDSVPSTKSETESRGRAAGSCSRVSRRVRVQERARFRWYPRGGPRARRPADPRPGWRWRCAQTGLSGNAAGGARGSRGKTEQTSQPEEVRFIVLHDRPRPVPPQPRCTVPPLPSVPFVSRVVDGLLEGDGGAL